MPSGGARLRSGPAANLNSLRNAGKIDEWETLPADGRPGEPPEWPLNRRPSSDERFYWDRLWSTPQAVMWERFQQHHAVAMYVYQLVLCETGEGAGKNGVTSADRTELRRQADALGLTITGLNGWKWRIQTEAEAAPTDGEVATARGRFSVVAGGGA